MPDRIAAASRNTKVGDVVDGKDGRASLIAALIWLIGFFVWFNTLGLPNNGGVGRWVLWNLIPFDLMDVIDPPTVSGAAPWSWLFLLQRVPFLAVAAGIWVGAWGMGSILLRLCRLELQGLERLFFSACLGLSVVSLTTLLLGVCACLDRRLMIAVLATGPLLEVLFHQRSKGPKPSHERNSQRAQVMDARIPVSIWLLLVTLVPFIAVQMIGAMTPQIDFDVVEYHLGGPKEWFQMGRITRLPHNVYTNFPFLSEMLILSGMVLYGDWQWGALAGQATIAGFAPLVAVGVFAAGQRWFSTVAGCFGSLIYLTSPWTYRISIIAYAEGSLACYLFASLYAAMLYRQRCLVNDGTSEPVRANPVCSLSEGSNDSIRTSARSLAFLMGTMSGSAMACKYTGLVSVVIPIALYLFVVIARDASTGRSRDWLMIVTSFSLGIGITIGPWLVKNAVATGNPVYPLAYQAFGGIDRDEELDLKWRRGHAAVNYNSLGERLKDFPVKVADVMANNDWHSALMFGFAPLSLLWFWRRSQGAERAFQQTILQVSWLYVIWQFLTWWVLTHHIDRFYVPMFSVVAFLAGVGAIWPVAFQGWLVPSQLRIWRIVSITVVAASILYNADVMLHLGGFNAGRIDLAAARDIATPNRIRWLNQEFENGRLGSSAKVLCVGEAQMFHARYPYLYDTVFDRCLFEQICAARGSSKGQLRPVEEIRSEFQRRGITHVDVNWAEIQRYRAPGSYGFTEFVQPDRFTELQRLGLLGPSLFTTTNDQTGAVTGQIFRVLTD